MNPFDRLVRQVQGDVLRSDDAVIVQANLGLRCNLRCRHCHVEASPERNELMTWPVMTAVLRLASTLRAGQVDLTGGAPELNPAFRRFVSSLVAAGHVVQVRTNLTVLDEPGQTDTPEFLARHRVKLAASLPCYLNENVIAQRGPEAYSRSIAVLRRLNALGYGRERDLPLDLVYNPGGPFLPPAQAALEADYRREMKLRHGIDFTRLLTIANVPAGRFLQELQARGKAQSYQSLLQENFNPRTLDRLMCRRQICVSWDGSLADCDFNLALGLGLAADLPTRIDVLNPDKLRGRPIVTGEHCFACTAGPGSSCGGALVA